MGEYFPKPKSLGANVRLCLSKCLIMQKKADLENATGVNT